jgi:3-oxoacyl-[acyl-carrier protein] reductase
MQSLANKHIIITGASQGIGRNIATSFLQNHSNIYLISRNKSKLLTLQKDLELTNPSNKIIKCFSADVANQSEIIDVFSAIGNIDILINNAGITRDNLIVRLSKDDWDSVINTNLNGTYNCCKIAAKYMIKQRSGKIINISSIVGQIGNKGQSNYAASKAGILGLTKSLAQELASRNITVNAINPGYINTKMTQELSEQNKDNFLSKIPLNKFGDVQDVSNLVCFLASNKSDYITGQTINVDGGLVMQ